MSYSVAINTVGDAQIAPASNVYSNTVGDRGAQLFVQTVNLGDDENTATISIVAIGDAESQECARWTGIVPNDTTVITFYPGITEGSSANATNFSFVLPAKYQIQASNALGLAMQIIVGQVTLP